MRSSRISSRLRQAMGLAAWALLLVSLAPIARAEEEEITTIRLTVTPADEPREEMKHQLLPGFLDRKPGNAAVSYHRAMLMAKRESYSKDQDKICEWLELPLEKLPQDEVEKLLGSYANVLAEVTLGARHEQCDWNIPVRESENPIAILLPEIQETRGLARIVALRARLQIAQGKTDEAIRTLQTGMALGRHVAESPFLVSGLVGIAICQIMSDELRALIERPDGPNLYWALTSLPKPPIDLGPAYEVEMHLVYLMFPELRDVETRQTTPEYWRDFFDRISKQSLLALLDGPDLSSDQTRAALAAMAIVGYPRARQALIEQGFAPERLDAMPAAQVVAIYTVRTFNEFRDRMFKWFSLPYWQAASGMAEADGFLQREGRQREIVPLASLLLPAVMAAKGAEARIEREVALLRTVEALRIHAARHDGRLPNRLEDVTEVPLPIDPFTGRQLVYRLEGKKAVLESLPSGLEIYYRRFEITIR